MRRASVNSAVALFIIAFAALLFPAILTATASAATGVEAAAEAQAKAVIQLLILERRVNDAETQVAQAEERLEQLQAQVEESSARAETAAADLEDARGRYAARMVETYKAGGVGWLELLLGSDNLSQFIGRTLMLGRILDQDAAFADEIDRTRREAEDAALHARESVEAQEEQVGTLRTTRDGLEKAQTEQAALVRSLGERLEAAKIAAAAAARKMAEVNASTKKSQAASATTRPPAVSTVTSRPTSTKPTTPPAAGRQLTVKSWAYALKGTTATGIPVARGVVAVDPRVIPLGTRLFVPGYGEAIAADTGGDIKGNIIDVWMPSLQEARAWGTRIVTITIYD